MPGAKNGHGIPPSKEKNERTKATNKILIFNPVRRNIWWLKFSVFGGINQVLRHIWGNPCIRVLVLTY